MVNMNPIIGVVEIISTIVSLDAAAADTELGRDLRVCQTHTQGVGAVCGVLPIWVRVLLVWDVVCGAQPEPLDPLETQLTNVALNHSINTLNPNSTNIGYCHS